MPSFYGRQDLYVDEQRSFSHVKAHLDVNPYVYRCDVPSQSFD